MTEHVAAMSETRPELDAIRRWFAASARDLPWRSNPDPWPVLVSEVMLQQTPVNRVLPVFVEWMRLWPKPSDLAAAAPGDALRVWGRLGYPRRALRLHEAARVCVDRFGGLVPADVASLRSLPGVGEYTAAAVASFAFGQRHAVLDTNVRRVHARWLDGVEFPSPSVTAAERTRALELLPLDPQAAANASAAVMELGALVCTARAPSCDSCPVAQTCSWRAAGHPAWDGAPRRSQAWAGTDRQCRGRLLAAVRDSAHPVPAAELAGVWGDADQRQRAITTLLHDGLVVQEPAGYRLP